MDCIWLLVCGSDQFLDELNLVVLEPAGSSFVIDHSYVANRDRNLDTWALARKCRFEESVSLGPVSEKGVDRTFCLFDVMVVYIHISGGYIQRDGMGGLVADPSERRVDYLGVLVVAVWRV